MTFDTVVLAAVSTSPRRCPGCGGHECAIESRSQVHPHRASAQRRRAGWDVRSSVVGQALEGGYEEGEDACGIARPGSPSVAKAS